MFTVRLGNIERVKELVAITSKYKEEITVIAESYELDAKSVLNLFKLNILNDVKICIYTDDIDTVRDFSCEIAEFNEWS